MMGIPKGQFFPMSSLLQAPVDNTKVHQGEEWEDVFSGADLDGTNRMDPEGETRREWPCMGPGEDFKEGLEEGGNCSQVSEGR